MILIKEQTITGSGETNLTSSGRNYAPTNHTIQISFIGAPTEVIIGIEATIDDVNYSELVEHTVSAQGLIDGFEMIHVNGKAVSLIRANIKSLVGGTTPSINVDYIGGE